MVEFRNVANLDAVWLPRWRRAGEQKKVCSDYFFDNSCKVRCVLPAISPAHRTQHLDSPIVDLPLPSIYAFPTIHTTDNVCASSIYLTFSLESLVLSDLLLPNPAL